MKSDIKTFKHLFQIKYDGDIGSKCTCLKLFGLNKEWYNCQKPPFSPLCLRKLILGSEKVLYSCIVDCDWRVTMAGQCSAIFG